MTKVVKKVLVIQLFVDSSELYIHNIIKISKHYIIGISFPFYYQQ